MTGLPGVEVLLLAGFAVLLGAVVQGSIGFGLGLVAAPVITLLEPRLMPVTLLLVTAALPALSVLREHSEVDWRGVGWALLGRLPGTGVGVAAVVLLSPRAIAVLVAVTVLAAVAISMVRWTPRLSRRALVTAGMLSAASGTATSIGAPPMALLYQRASGPQMRATLAAFFSVGVVISVVSLAAAGQVHRGHVLTAGVLLVPMLTGFALSGPLRRVVDAGRTRRAVLVLVTASALALLWQAARG